MYDPRQLESAWAMQQTDEHLNFRFLVSNIMETLSSVHFRCLNLQFPKTPPRVILGHFGLRKLGRSKIDDQDPSSAQAKVVPEGKSQVQVSGDH